MEVVSFNKNGELVILHHDKRYTYFQVPVYQKEQVERHIKHKRFGTAWNLLKHYSKLDNGELK